LQTTEAGGMGEGWSDAFAEWLEQTPEVKDFTLGRYERIHQTRRQP